MQQSKVSVIIPAYNASGYISQAIDSVLQQTYQNFELVVVDDGSTDETAEIMKSYGSRVRYFRKENGGGSSARNYGIARSKGEFIAPLDADDMWKPGKLAKTMAVFAQKPMAEMVFTACTIVDDGGQPLFDFVPIFDKQKFYLTLLKRNIVPNGTVVFRKKILEIVGGYDENIFIPNDWDLWIRIAEVAEVEYLVEPLSFYRRAATSISQDLERQLREQVYVINKTVERNKSLTNKTAKQVYASWHFSMAQACLKAGRNRRAFQALVKSIKIYPHSYKSWMLLGLVFTGAAKVGVVKDYFLR